MATRTINRARSIPEQVVAHANEKPEPDKNHLFVPTGSALLTLIFL